MNQKINCLLSAVLGMLLLVPGASSASTSGRKPNLLIIHTDEHNFRTLGCYRDLMTDEQAYMWGAGVEVKTPNLDRIADEGAICTSYYAANPVCAPSRASFISGLYPIATGVFKNGLPLQDEIVSFAEVLSQQGYATSYVGKWHLSADEYPGFAPQKKFGFADNQFMFNGGHWKQILERDGALAVFKSGKAKLNETNHASFTTDFLVTKTLDILKRDKNQPFCHMISIPDPHGPNKVRPPYNSMYDDLFFEKPRTMGQAKADRPGWSFGKNQADELVQQDMRAYFGMVKCIDDNVGRILQFLEDEGLAEHTILIFTSDHGDLMGEHNKHNKSSPYEASARIPFIIRYPHKIPPGKVIETACTTVDFAPTILGLMNAGTMPETQGIDTSADFLSPDMKVEDGRIVYLTTALSSWTAAVNSRYKYVLSPFDEPWLFDLKVNPDETINFCNHPDYRALAKKFDTELKRQMRRYDEPALAAWKDEETKKKTIHRIRVEEYKTLGK